jgi:filamentous hemagglutinin
LLVAGKGIDAAGKYLNARAATVAERVEVEAGKTAGSIRNVNPNYPAVGRTQNCVNCTVATDATLAGNPAVALPSNGPVSISVLESQYGGRFGSAISAHSIEQEMLKAGDGARGIIFGSRGANEAGHVFNVVNQNGTIRFLDGQIGTPAAVNGYNSLHLLKTN